MNLNRREFLKITLAGAVVAAVPAIATTLPDPNPEKKKYVTFSCGKQPAGNYWFSFHYKKAGETEWRRYAEIITLKEEMRLDATAELEKDDLLTWPQVEWAKEDQGCVTNMCPNLNYIVADKYLRFDGVEAYKPHELENFIGADMVFRGT